MEILIFVGVIALLIGAYVGIKVYVQKVSEKYNYNIEGSITRFIPVGAWVAVVVMEVLAEIRSTETSLPLEIAIIVISVVVYAIILYVKTKSILHSILISILKSVVGMVVAILLMLKFVMSFFTGGNGTTEKRTSDRAYSYSVGRNFTADEDYRATQLGFKNAQDAENNGRINDVI